MARARCRLVPQRNAAVSAGFAPARSGLVPRALRMLPILLPLLQRSSTYSSFIFSVILPLFSILFAAVPYRSHISFEVRCGVVRHPVGCALCAPSPPHGARRPRFRIRLLPFSVSFSFLVLYRSAIGTCIFRGGDPVSRRAMDFALVDCRCAALLLCALVRDLRVVVFQGRCTICGGFTLSRSGAPRIPLSPFRSALFSRCHARGLVLHRTAIDCACRASHTPSLSFLIPF